MSRSRALAVAAVLAALVFPLAGCGGGNTDNGSADNGAAATTTSGAATAATSTAGSTMAGSNSAVATPGANGAAGPMQPHRSFAERHKTATSLAAGIAAYQIAKHTGANRAAAGGHKNWAQRHPMATAVGAAMLTHHAISVQQRKHQQ
ncbi:MAG: hypothetical protein LC772_00875 [Chloroflexi bacterium]|nr:hypothetical protein [Chloroflexota bacterium]